MIDFKTGEGKERELPPVGNHVAVLYSIIEIGTLEGEYMGQAKKSRKIRLTWELPDETREFDGVQKPMVVGKTYTISLFEGARLRPIVVGMLGGLSEEDEETFNIKGLLGKPCMLQIAHDTFNDRKFASVVSAAQLPKSMKAPKQFNPSQYLDYSDGWNDEVYAALPQFMKDKMGESEEMKRKINGDDYDPFKKEESGDDYQSPF